MFARPLTATTNSATATAIPSERDVDGHLSEGIPRYWLLDNSALETFVDNELRFGLQLAVEAKLLTDVNGTSGIQTQQIRHLGADDHSQGPDQAGDGGLRRLVGHLTIPEPTSTRRRRPFG